MLKTDICVIGSGPGGGIPAVTLSTAGHKVLLVEAGPMTQGSGPNQFVGNADIHGQNDLPVMGTVQLGGSSNLWAGRIAPMEPIDFERRDWVSGSGWPLAIQDLPYDRALELLAGVSRMPRYQPVNDGLGNFVQDNSLDYKYFYWSAEAFNVAKYIERSIEAGNKNLTILSDSPVEKLLEAENGNTISAALIRRPDGSSLRIEAKLFILAAGGLETPRILLSSSDQKAKGIGNGTDLVGRYLSTHPKADIATLKLSRRVSTGSPLYADRSHQGGRLRVGLGFEAEEQRRLGLLNHYVQITPFLEYRASRGFELLRGSKALNSPFFDSSKLGRGTLPSLGLFLFEAISRLGGLQQTAQSFILRAFLDQYPNPENRVTLSKTRGQSGMPALDIKWEFGAEDRASVILFLKQLDRRLRNAQIGELDFERLLHIDGEWPLTGIHSHFMGTTRMGVSPDSGVVDENCRVFGTQNLYVSGPSVFPTYGYANPFATITALALRLSDHINHQLT